MKDVRSLCAAAAFLVALGCNTEEAVEKQAPMEKASMDSEAAPEATSLLGKPLYRRSSLESTTTCSLRRRTGNT